MSGSRIVMSEDTKSVLCKIRKQKGLLCVNNGKIKKPTVQLVRSTEEAIAVKPKQVKENTNTMVPNSVKGTKNDDQKERQFNKKKENLLADMMIGKAGKKPEKKDENPWITVGSSLSRRLNAAASTKGLDIKVKKEIIGSSNELYLQKKTGDEYFNKPNEEEDIQKDEEMVEFSENMSISEEEETQDETAMDMECEAEAETTEEVIDITGGAGGNDEADADYSEDVDMEISELDGNNQPIVVKRKNIMQHNEQSPKKKIIESKNAKTNTGKSNALKKFEPKARKDTIPVTPEKNTPVKKKDWIELEEEEDQEDEQQNTEKESNPKENKKEAKAIPKGSKTVTESIKTTTQEAKTNESQNHTTKKQQGGKEANEASTSKKQVSIETYAEKIKGKKKTPKENCIRLRFMFNAKKSGDKPQVLQLLTSLMEIANMIDEEAMIMPWDEKGFDNGPIDKNDVIYQTKLSVSDAKRYLDLPIDVQRTGFTSGKTEYGLGVRITTSLTARIFKNSWDLTKKDRIQKGKQFIAVKLAELQHSPNAFLVGVVAGSTEGMEIDSINKGLEKEIDIKGIGASYQQFHQSGITPAMWKEANQKAEQVSDDKKSRAYIRAKYAWAPEGLCIYVDSKKKVTEARKKLIGKYGECDKDGNLPIWPGGSRMRFIPLKSTWIKNEKTRNKVEKRVKYHVYCKGNEYEEPTQFKNISDTIPSFKGKTFQEIVLDIDSKKKPGIKLFRHFKHTWTPDPKVTKWSISAHSIMTVEASQKLQSLKQDMEESYGSEIVHFFQEERRTMYASRGKPNKPLKFDLEEDDEEDWFKTDNDILSVQEKSIMVEGIPEEMGNKGNPEATDASWGSPISYAALSTDSTAMKDTDIEVEGSNDTEVTSTITNSTTEADTTEIKARKFRVRKALAERGVKPTMRNLIMNGTAPYDMIVGNFNKSDYSHDTMVELIWMIYQNWEVNTDNKDTPTNEETPKQAPDEPPDKR